MFTAEYFTGVIFKVTTKNWGKLLNGKLIWSPNTSHAIFWILFGPRNLSHVSLPEDLKTAAPEAMLRYLGLVHAAVKHLKCFPKNIISFQLRWDILNILSKYSIMIKYFFAVTFRVISQSSSLKENIWISG